MKKVLAVILFFTFVLQAQTYTITEVFEDHIFKLDNGQLVSPYGITIPEAAKNNPNYEKLNRQILEFDVDHFLNKTFRFEFIGVKDSSVVKAKIFYDYAFTSSDQAKTIVRNGYAVIALPENYEYYNELYPSQKDAKRSMFGIWGLKLDIDEKLLVKKELENFNIGYDEDNYTVITKRPNIGFLAVSLLAAGTSALAFSLAAEDDDDFLTTFVVGKPVLNIIGAVTAGTAVLTTIYALKEVEVKTYSNGATLSVKF